MTALALAALLTVTPPTGPTCATSGPRIVRHDAMAHVLTVRPWLRTPGAYYIATNDCADLGEWRALIVGGRVYIVRIADCAAAGDVDYRERMGYEADVGKELWETEGWPYCPIAATVLTIPELFTLWKDLAP